MKKFATLLILAGLGVVPALAATTTFHDVPVVDQNCSRKVMAHPDTHTRSCVLMCAKSGFGIIENGKFIKFDAKGNEELLPQLKASHEKDHLRVNVTGTVKGDEIAVSSVHLLK